MKHAGRSNNVRKQDDNIQMKNTQHSNISDKTVFKDQIKKKTNSTIDKNKKGT